MKNEESKKDSSFFILLPSPSGGLVSSLLGEG